MANRAVFSLNKGDSVRVIAPGMPYNKQNFSRAVAILKSWELDVEVPKGLLGPSLICANSREKRSILIKEAVKSPAKIIWCARGGYGSLHLLDGLARLKRPKSQKLLIGFSDITTLHQHFNQQWGWSSLHGPHIESLATMTPVRLKRLHELLFGKVTELEYKNLKPLNRIAYKAKNIKGTVVGGNLITLQSTLGTRWQLNAKNKIVFLEDIGERAYRVDRVLEHMRYLGLWKQAKAIVFGSFTGGEEPGGRASKVPRLLSQFAEAQKIPVYKGLSVGHNPNSRPLPLNTVASLKTISGRTTLYVKTGLS